MSMRVIPPALHAEVLDLALAIVNAREAGRRSTARGALRRLKALYLRHKRAGAPDPFLTETLADFTAGPRSSAKLYREAIAQSAAFPGEPVYTKQMALAERLKECGHFEQARATLVQAIAAASSAGDAESVMQASELLACVKARVARSGVLDAGSSE